MQQHPDPNEPHRLPSSRKGAGAAGWGASVPWLGVPLRVTLGAVVVVLALAALAFLGPRFVNVAAPSPTPTPEPTATVAALTSSPAPPPPTPEGTPGAKPSEPVDSSAPADLTPPPTQARATPTPSPQPGLWRIEGYVFDEAGKPLKGVCVTGPRGCFPYTPHTDERGYWYLDVAQPINGITTTFDFYFEMPGRQTVWWHFVPTSPIEFNVVLRPN